MSKRNSESQAALANYNDTISWQHPLLEIRETGRYGKGVFSRGEISADEPLLVIGGRILTREEERALSQNLFEMSFEIAERFSIAPRSFAYVEQSAHWFLNHGCDPNAGFRGQIIVAALRPISRDEEIVIDYAMCLRPGEPFSLTCLCGSPLCRHSVTNNDWKRPELQKRYNGYFQWYLQEKINRLRVSDSYPPARYEIRPSRIHGQVGLFALVPFTKGRVIIPCSNFDESRLITWDEFATIDPVTQRKLIDFCYKTPQGIHAPRNINQINIGWFCNHSCDPTIVVHENGDYVAVRDIEVGEELTFDFELMMKATCLEFTCRCGSPKCRGVIRI